MKKRDATQRQASTMARSVRSEVLHMYGRNALEEYLRAHLIQAERRGAARERRRAKDDR